MPVRGRRFDRLKEGNRDSERATMAAFAALEASLDGAVPIISQPLVSPAGSSNGLAPKPLSEDRSLGLPQVASESAQLGAARTEKEKLAHQPVAGGSGGHETRSRVVVVVARAGSEGSGNDEPPAEGVRVDGGDEGDAQVVTVDWRRYGGDEDHKWRLLHSSSGVRAPQREFRTRGER